ncbi:uncharacterized protein [Macrobrachium rosenbergii]|uniref:uncharacterized protein n=1 Tax=Macrobrachium rosenbergii TaxID=79674 RepID=UPI0034D4085D
MLNQPPAKKALLEHLQSLLKHPQPPVESLPEEDWEASCCFNILRAEALTHSSSPSHQPPVASTSFVEVASADMFCLEDEDDDSRREREIQHPSPPVASTSFASTSFISLVAPQPPVASTSFAPQHPSCLSASCCFNILRASASCCSNILHASHQPQPTSFVCLVAQHPLCISLLLLQHLCLLSASCCFNILRASSASCCFNILRASSASCCFNILRLISLNILCASSASSILRCFNQPPVASTSFVPHQPPVASTSFAPHQPPVASTSFVPLISLLLLQHPLCLSSASCCFNILRASHQPPVASTASCCFNILRASSASCCFNILCSPNNLLLLQHPSPDTSLMLLQHLNSLLLLQQPPVASTTVLLQPPASVSSWGPVVQHPSPSSASCCHYTTVTFDAPAPVKSFEKFSCFNILCASQALASTSFGVSASTSFSSHHPVASDINISLLLLQHWTSASQNQPPVASPLCLSSASCCKILCVTFTKVVFLNASILCASHQPPAKQTLTCMPPDQTSLASHLLQHPLCLSVASIVSKPPVAKEVPL